MSQFGPGHSTSSGDSVAPPGLALVSPLEDEAPAAAATPAVAVVRPLRSKPRPRRSKRVVAPGQVRSPQELIEMGEIATDPQVVELRAGAAADAPYRFPGCAHPADMLALLDAAATVTVTAAA